MTKRVYRFTVYFFLFCLLSCCILSGCAGNSEAKVLAKVNNEEIEQKEVEEFLNLIYLFMPDTQETYSQGEYAEMLEEEVLWFLIENKVAQQEIKKLGLELDEQKVEQDFQEVKEELINGIYKSEEEFAKRLAELSLDEEMLKILQRNAHISELLYEHVSADVTEEQAKAFVEEHPEFLEKPAEAYVFHILLETEEEASHVYQLLQDGNDFVEVGKEYSLDSHVELGRISEHDMLDPVFLDAVFSLEPGGISEPVKTQAGYHIIKITEKEEARELTFEEVKEEALEIKRREHFEDYFKKLMEDAAVETFKN